MKGSKGSGFTGGKPCLVSALPDPSCWRRAHTCRSRYKRRCWQRRKGGRKLHCSVHEFAPVCCVAVGGIAESFKCSMQCVIRSCVTVCVQTLVCSVYFFIKQFILCVRRNLRSGSIPFCKLSTNMSAIDLRRPLVLEKRNSPLKKNFVKE
jgi:hypothetical protein